MPKPAPAITNTPTTINTAHGKEAFSGSPGDVGADKGISLEAFGSVIVDVETLEVLLVGASEDSDAKPVVVGATAREVVA